MKNIGIGIIGAGTAGAISCLSMIARMFQHEGINLTITCISDPNKPTAQVGESTSGLVYELMRNVLRKDFAKDLDLFDGTLRYYTKYFWSESNQQDFCVYYDKPGMHLNSDKWSDYVLKELSNNFDFFNSVYDEVISTESYDHGVKVIGKESSYMFHYLIDCGGMPSKEAIESDAYETSVFESVNSVIIFPHFNEYHEAYTSSYFHSNGWMFGVPLYHRKAFGYLYNNKVTSYEEACESFSKIKNVDAKTLRNFSWKPYYKKEALKDRILSMGNKIYFFEPQQAIPLHYYANLSDVFMQGLIAGAPNGHLTLVINNFHLEAMQNIQDLIALNYSGENNPNSKFWSSMPLKAREHLKNSSQFQDWISRVDQSGEILGYAPADQSMLKTLFKGLKIDLNNLRK